MANVLAVFAHPDDEVLGCGGTLAKHAQAGDRIAVVILADRGIASHADMAMRALGVEDLTTLGYPDQQMDTERFVAIVGSIEYFRGFDPDIIYTHHPGDLNLDHALTARAVLTAFRPKPGMKPRRIMACEVLSSTEYTYPRVFQPNWYEALNAIHVGKKQDAMKCYPSEAREWPHARSKAGIWTWAGQRGVECGVELAEAFQLLRAGPF